MDFRLLIVLWLAAGCSAQDHILQSNSTENLRGISSPSPTTSWASGTHGTYLRTLDGGTTWRAAQVPGAESLDFRDVEAFSASVAYLLSAGPGEQSRIYKTTDGGARWMLQFTNHDPKGFLDCMAFWDRDHGIVLGDPVPAPQEAAQSGLVETRRFFLLVTDDGGGHWNRIPPQALPPVIASEGAFAASGTCLTVQGKNNVWFATGGTAARVFRSTDRGKTWAAAETPIAHGDDSSGIFSIAFRDPNHGVIAGGNYQHPDQGGPNLALSDDGGVTWKLSPIAPQSYFSAVAFPPKPRSAILVVGSTRAAYTDDARKKVWSKSWDLNLNALAIDKTGNALAVGPKGAIVRFRWK